MQFIGPMYYTGEFIIYSTITILMVQYLIQQSYGVIPYPKIW